MFQYTLSTQLD